KYGLVRFRCTMSSSPSCSLQLTTKAGRTSLHDRLSSSLHAHHLTQRVNHLDQVNLGGDHRVDVLIGHRRLVDHFGVLAAFNAFRGAGMVLNREASLGFGPAHRPSRAMRTRAETVRIALSAHD